MPEYPLTFKRFSPFSIQTRGQVHDTRQGQRHRGLARHRRLLERTAQRSPAQGMVASVHTDAVAT